MSRQFGTPYSFVSTDEDRDYAVPITYLAVPGAAAAGRLKVWTGSAWDRKPAKVWSGSAWVTKPVKIWNGSAWV